MMQNILMNEKNMLDKNYQKVSFRLEKDEDGYPPADYEHLWAQEVNSGLMLDNIPFFAYGVSWGDVVAVEPVNGLLMFTSVKEYSHHSTVRLLLRDPSEWEPVKEEIASLGCSGERSHLPRLVAVDIPPDVDIDAVRAYLSKGLSEERFEYEEGAVWWDE